MQCTKRQEEREREKEKKRKRRMVETGRSRNFALLMFLLFFKFKAPSQILSRKFDSQFIQFAACDLKITKQRFLVYSF